MVVRKKKQEKRNLSPFEHVYEIAREIPHGKVYTYGLISKRMNKRLSAAAVGWAMKALGSSKGESEYTSDNVPWHRVINSKGKLSTQLEAGTLSDDGRPENLQRILLEQEGVVFRNDDSIDLNLFLWENESQGQSLSELKDQIKRATIAIEQAHKLLHESASSQNSDTVIYQVVQHSAMLPSILAQQLRMIEGLEHKFCDQFASNCREEIEEIANTAKLIHSSMENANTSRNRMDVPAQNDFAKVIFESTSRLNILQQRIAGKMMKVK